MKKFWAFVLKAKWTSDHDYNRIAKMLYNDYSEEEIIELKNNFNELYNGLYKRFEKDWLESIPASDDSWSDLLSHVIGSGKWFYEKITVEKLREMASDFEYKESFAYSFLKPSETDIRPTVKAADLLDWVYSEKDDIEILGRNMLAQLKESGKAYIDIQTVFDNTGYIPAFICGGVIDDRTEFDKSEVRLIK